MTMTKYLLAITAMLLFGGTASAQTPLGSCPGTVGVVAQASGLAVTCTPAVVLPVPTVAFSASPTSITAGQSSTLTWSSTNATVCTGSGGWSGSLATGGTSSVTPSVNTTYTLTCTGSGGSAAASATVTVTAVLMPTVNLTAAPTSVTAGQSSTLTWSSTNATSCLSSGGWSGSEPLSGTLMTNPLSATATYTLTCTGAGGSASASAIVTVSPITGANCGMQLGGPVIFCEPFDVVNSGTPSRTGALDPNVWGVSRTTGNVNSGQGQFDGWAATQIRTCSGTVTVTPPNDVVICNAQLREASNDNPAGCLECGTVTTLAMYPKQPFDFAGRTGTVSFDVSNDTHTGHSAWPEFWMSDLPVPAPFTHFDGWASVPQNGFGIRLSAQAPAGVEGLCPNANNLNVNRWTVGSAIVVRNYVFEDDVVDASATFGVASNPPLKLNILDCVISSPDNSGILNHVEVRVTPGEIDVYATDAGVAASPTTLRKIATVTNANLTLTRGLVWLEDSHYNADKGNPPSQRQHTFVWDNLAFDGPFTYRDFSYDALDNNSVAGDGSINLGKYSLPGASVSWNVLGLPASPNPAAVRVLFNFFHNTQPTTLNITVNGHAHAATVPFHDMTESTWRTFAMTVPVTDLVTGTNVVTLSASDQDLTWANVNIVLGDVPGGVPVLPGNSRAYPGP